MMLKKSFFLLLKSFLSFLFIFLCLPFSFLYKTSYLDLPNSKFSQMFFSFSLDFSSILFLCMVFFVTSLVLLFSEVYMEHYNNKKFFFLTFIFLISMLFLSSSGSFMNLMIGWDGLGISSLCLIMFYPNKITMFNSFLTFFFNRLGDVVLMLVFSSFLLSSSTIFFLSDLYNPFLISMLILCAFTKSAQFPLSSWLPAAMSAPTPISAMVHSSTLVTAGVFILMKMFYFLEFHSLGMIPLIFSTITFLAGGLMANMEMDLKKIVAFSTMSQISMIILILSLGFFMISIFHTLTHALFKTLLFCSCGMIFMWNFSDQLSKVSILSKSNKSLFYLLFSSVFSMSGLVFSSSFFTKDVVLEILLSENLLCFFLLFLIGGLATIMYSSSILNSFSHSSHSYFSSISSSKKFFFFFLILFSFLTLLVKFFFLEAIPLSILPMISSSEILALLFLMCLPLAAKNFPFKVNFSFVSSEIFFMKFFSFSFYSNFLKLDKSSFFFSDQFFLKPYLYSLSFSIKYTFSFNFFFFLIIIILFLIF